MNTDNRDDHRSLENELRAALTHRAEQVRPSDRWEEIAMTSACMVRSGQVPVYPARRSMIGSVAG